MFSETDDIFTSFSTLEHSSYDTRFDCMTTTIDKDQCITCGKGKAACMCVGCSRYFCFQHLAEHRQLLERQLDDIENERNLFRQSLIEQKTNPLKHSLIQQIDKWEHESINKIQQTAEEARQLLVQHIKPYIDTIEIKLIKLTEQLKEIRQENDINEMILNELKEEFKHLQEELVKPSNVSIKEDTSSFLSKISVVVRFQQMFIPNIIVNATWIQNGITIAGGKGHNSGLNQLYEPWGLYVDDDQTTYIADCSNHRILQLKYDAINGQIIAGGNGGGNKPNQLNHPTHVIVDKKNDCLIISDEGNKRVVRWSRKNNTNGETIISNIVCRGLTMDNDEYLYVSDYEKHEVRKWKIGNKNGIVVAGGNGKGNRFDQLNHPTCIFVDRNHSIYISDKNNHRVMKWTKDEKEGVVVAGGQGEGKSLTKLCKPYGVVVDQLDTIYVADCGNDRVMRWRKGATQGSVIIGGNGSGDQANQLNYPIGLSFDRQNNLYIVEHGNERVQKFNIQ